MVNLAKAQSAIEFLATYGWAILVMLSFLAALYYFGAFSALNILQRQCNFQPGFGCDYYKLMVNDSGMQVVLFGYNGMGFDLGFDSGTATLSAENLGAEGKYTFTGTCTPNLVGKGGNYTCTFDLPPIRVPRQGEMRKMELAIQYRDCESAPNYNSTWLSCAGAQTHTVTGTMITQAEPYT